MKVEIKKAKQELMDGFNLAKELNPGYTVEQFVEFLEKENHDISVRCNSIGRGNTHLPDNLRIAYLAQESLINDLT